MKYTVCLFLILLASCKGTNKKYPDHFQVVNFDYGSDELLLRAIESKNHYDGRADGRYTQFYGYTQMKAATIAWENGLRNGRWVFFYQNGDTAVDVFYVNGELSKLYKDYYPNGKLRLTISNLVTQSNCISIAKDCTINPVTKEKECKFDTIYFRNFYDGDWLYYWENGRKKKKQHFKNCILQDAITTWYESGIQCTETEKNINAGDSFVRNPNAIYLFEKSGYGTDTLFFKSDDDTFILYKEDIPPN